VGEPAEPGQVGGGSARVAGQGVLTVEHAAGKSRTPRGPNTSSEPVPPRTITSPTPGVESSPGSRFGQASLMASTSGRAGSRGNQTIPRLPPPVTASSGNPSVDGLRSGPSTGASVRPRRGDSTDETSALTGPHSSPAVLSTRSTSPARISSAIRSASE
jgi:hypothetical protein